MTEPLRIAVVGHTNTGKTSLMRTLTRDVSLGEVSDRPAVTRHVEGASLLVGGEPMIELYDTPGLEDSIGLLEHLDRKRGGEARIDGHASIESFLDSPSSREEFAQEAKALRQVVASHVALYVIDARERVLGKHHDELEILARCARPIVPVLNFVASNDNRISEWRDQLARVNLHAVAEFDTFVVDSVGERRLFEKISTMVDGFRVVIDRLIEDREAHRASLVRGAADIVADMLIDVAAYRMPVETRNGTAIEAAMSSMREVIREREREAVRALLSLFRFREEDCRAADLPIEDGSWGMDVFSPDALRLLGVKAGRSAATGAMIGLSLDVMSAGLSLGTGTAIGAALGAAFEGTRAHGRRLLDRMRGRSELRPTEATVRVLLAREVWLVRALLSRGHAAMTPVDVGMATDVGREALPEALRAARVHAHWSSMATSAQGTGSDPSRATASSRLQSWLSTLFAAPAVDASRSTWRDDDGGGSAMDGAPRTAGVSPPAE